MAKPLPKAARELGSTELEVWRLRVEYAELGRLAMLSHLEVARFLERVVRRADLPYAVTHGFSPHMRIAFGGALPVGIGGEREIFDVFLRSRVDEAWALAAMQAVTVPDMPMLSARYISRREPAASVAYPFSTYRVELSGCAERLVLPDEVVIERKGKQKVLKTGDFLVGNLKVQGNVIEFTLEAKETGALRPDALVACMLEHEDGLVVRSFMRTGIAKGCK